MSRPGDDGEPGGAGDPTAASADAGADAVTSAFDFEPDSVSSDDDDDFTGDGVVDHHDVHEALSGFHDFHVDEPAPAQHEPVDHHPEHHLHDGGHHGAELFGF